MSAVVVPGGATRGQVVQRVLLGVLVAALVGVMAVGLGSFVWPSGVANGTVRLAPADSFQFGSVSSYRFTADWEIVPQRGAIVTDWPSPTSYGDPRSTFYVIRFPNGDFRVFSAVSTHQGWMVMWTPTRTSDVTEDHVGFFVSVHDEQWAINGTRVFGPAPRNLDYYLWHIDEAGVLVVELAEVIEGERGGPVPPPYDVTAEGWATSGWPSE